MYTKKEYDRDLKYNLRYIKQTKPVVIILIITLIISIISLVFGIINSDIFSYVTGLAFTIISILFIIITLLGCKFAKLEIAKMVTDPKKYILERRSKPKVYKKVKSNPRTLEEDLDDFMFYDEMEE